MNPHAFSLAMRGLRVFALAPGAKYPAAAGWQERATADPFAAGDTIPESANVGIDTTGYFVVDIDAGKGGLEAFERLKALGDIPETFTVRSARGGLHLYFRPKNGEKFRSRAYRVIPGNYGRETEVFALAGFKGIDVRADGGLVVGPGSTFEGKPYEVATDAPIAELPDFIADLAHKAAPRVAANSYSESDVELDQPDAILRATAYLMAAPPAVERQGGDNHTIVVANRVMDYGIAPDTAAGLMLEHWDSRCVPEWGFERLQAKCHSAAKGRHDKLGREIRDDVFTVVDTIVSTADPILSSPHKNLVQYPREISIKAIAEDAARALVRGLIHPGETVLLYGDPAAGKTFCALDIAFHVALGKSWHGRKVTRSSVLYVSLEGNVGFDKRTAAAVSVHGDPGKHFDRLRAHVSLSRAAQDFGVQNVVAVVPQHVV